MWKWLAHYWRLLTDWKHRGRTTPQPYYRSNLHGRHR